MVNYTVYVYFKTKKKCPNFDINYLPKRGPADKNQVPPLRSRVYGIQKKRLGTTCSTQQSVIQSDFMGPRN